VRLVRLLGNRFPNHDEVVVLGENLPDHFDERLTDRFEDLDVRPTLSVLEQVP
jgi:hypothetical protein